MIELDGVRKKLGGRQLLDGLSFVVPEGAVFGLVGAPGAGRSTTLRILATLVRPDAGRASVAGVSVDDGPAVRRLVGYLPERCGAYRDMTALDSLVFYAGVHGVAPARRRPLAGEVLEVLGLDDRAGAAVTGLSTGQRRRLALGRTLVHDPAVLLLDEPTAGLDPESAGEVRSLLVDLAAMGRTMLVTGRSVADVEPFATLAGALRDGRLVACGPPAEVRAALGEPALGEPAAPVGAAEG